MKKLSLAALLSVLLLAACGSGARETVPVQERPRAAACMQRDFEGAASLFAVVLNPVRDPAVAAFVDSLKLFGIGSSWGGFESLVTVIHAEAYRTATRWNPGGPALRLHIGLEDPADLLADLIDAKAPALDPVPYSFLRFGSR